MRVSQVIAMLENYIEYLEGAGRALSEYEQGQLDAYQFILNQIKGGGKND